MRVHDTMDKILLIDDDATVQRMLRKAFESSGFEVTCVADGAIAMAIFAAEAPRAVVMEPRVPGRSGPDLCRDLRSKSARIPILVLSAETSELDKVLFLELGADDYITKPFSSRELLARVRAAIRRSNQHASPTSAFAFGEIEINTMSMEVFRQGAAVRVTPQEFKMLRFFLHNEGRVIPESELLHEVWNDRNYPASRTIATHILRLRQKLELNPSKPAHFRTVHGAGYRFVR
jgi:DNA-binding response OmpR family regulator